MMVPMLKLSTFVLHELSYPQLYPLWWVSVKPLKNLIFAMVDCRCDRCDYPLVHTYPQ